ncbi:relaxase/mobilization nuclease domain-containing protein [Breoghania sp. JC706]|uniref:relaxase/mobilization nuclease domain-containing protein n=1 Tax=Breoghania sp. JC706 TaxID=3117732 RepID=UPI0030089C5F
MSNEIVVKQITRSRDLCRLLPYISRKGTLTVHRSERYQGTPLDPEIIRDRARLRRFVNEWTEPAGPEPPTNGGGRRRRFAHLMISYPGRPSTAQAQQAVRDCVWAYFHRGHDSADPVDLDYLFSLHEDTDHTHAHIVVNRQDVEDRAIMQMSRYDRYLNPPNMREIAARTARDAGIDARATSRAERGIMGRAMTDGQYWRRWRQVDERYMFQPADREGERENEDEAEGPLGFRPPVRDPGFDEDLAARRAWRAGLVRNAEQDAHLRDEAARGWQREIEERRRSLETPIEPLEQRQLALQAARLALVEERRRITAAVAFERRRLEAARAAAEAAERAEAENMAPAPQEELPLQIGDDDRQSPFDSLYDVSDRGRRRAAGAPAPSSGAARGETGATSDPDRQREEERRDARRQETRAARENEVHGQDPTRRRMPESPAEEARRQGGRQRQEARAERENENLDATPRRHKTPGGDAARAGQTPADANGTPSRQAGPADPSGPPASPAAGNMPTGSGTPTGNETQAGSGAPHGRAAPGAAPGAAQGAAQGSGQGSGQGSDQRPEPTRARDHAQAVSKEAKRRLDAARRSAREHQASRPAGGDSQTLADWRAEGNRLREAARRANIVWNRARYGAAGVATRAEQARRDAGAPAVEPWVARELDALSRQVRQNAQNARSAAENQRQNQGRTRPDQQSASGHPGGQPGGQPDGQTGGQTGGRRPENEARDGEGQQHSPDRTPDRNPDRNPGRTPERRAR